MELHTMPSQPRLPLLFAPLQRRLDAAVERAAHAQLAVRAELVNRLDRIVPFAPLSPEAVQRVPDRELRDLAAHRALTERKASARIVSAPS